MFEAPSVDELRAFYSRYNDTYTAGMGERFNSEGPRRHAAKLQKVRRLAPRGTVLDVGCGEGLFLSMALAAGYVAEGCDFGLRSSYPPGVKVLEGRLDSDGGLPYADNTFDVVTFWAVIEHVRDPAAALREIHRVLKPGGVLFCDTPLVGDLCERLASHRPAWVYPPEHINVFSGKGLGAAVRGAGFSVLVHHHFYERNPLRWWLRRGRNILNASGGAVLRLFDVARWRELRRSRFRAVGDIQLIVARR